MRDRLTGSTALAVLAVGFAACSSVPARAQNADILSRLDALERENAELKQEMQALKARLAGQPERYAWHLAEATEEPDEHVTRYFIDCVRTP